MHYIIRKTAALLATLVLVSLSVFLAFHVIPGDPAMLILGTEASEEKLAILRAELGTDRPLFFQYVDWIVSAVHGDFGMSLKYRKSVSELMRGRVLETFILGLTAFAMVLVVGIPLGIISGSSRHRLLRHSVTMFSMIGISVPGFFLGILIIWFFGLHMHLFVPGHYDGLSIMFPSVAVALPQIAVLTKYLSASVSDEYSKNYVRTARSHGNSHIRILFRHVLKNATVSVLPLIGMITGSLFSGSIIVEQVFGISGIGRLLISSVTSRDFPLTQTIVMYIAAAIVFVNFLVDILIQLVDPRIRLKG